MGAHMLVQDVQSKNPGETVVIPKYIQIQITLYISLLYTILYTTILYTKLEELL
jgi:hypothetical protein